MARPRRLLLPTGWGPQAPLPLANVTARPRANTRYSTQTPRGACPACSRTPPGEGLAAGHQYTARAQGGHTLTTAHNHTTQLYHHTTPPPDSQESHTPITYLHTVASPITSPTSYKNKQTVLLQLGPAPPDQLPTAFPRSATPGHPCPATDPRVSRHRADPPPPRGSHMDRRAGHQSTANGPSVPETLNGNGQRGGRHTSPSRARPEGSTAVLRCGRSHSRRPSWRGK